MFTTPLRNALLALCVASVPAAAQSFNIDLGTTFVIYTPANTYGAAANQPGTWNPITSTTGASHALLDLNGAAAGVTMSHIGGFGDFAVGNPNWSGDDEALMEDAYDVANGSITFTFTGLQAGTYEVYSYALAPDFPETYRTRVAITGALEPAQIVGGAWLGSPHVLGVSYAKHTIVVGQGQPLSVTFSNPGSPAGNLATANGLQLKRTGSGGGGGPSGTPFCPGDGTGAACPCGNTSAFGANEGCLNSLGLGGKLVAVGTSSISNDTIVLQGSNMPNAPGLYFQGTAQQSSGLGIAFGDGLRCAVGAVTRLGTRVNASGASVYPAPGGLPVSVVGGVAAPGTRTYQIWYRNAADFCTPSSFNLTNGLELNWAP
jgi:hypothetical protein